ncbi:hypothetical protein PGIGA_G00258750 [Pangasianodon gigas]|uniref:Uncharacterized protein n=1 Tax=Pangasianodon gigas TaxID=30993 RepID=A0ACC5WSK7_PANGG|nr:hypothetical protein [Pangasianodon gigas]
MFRQLHFLVCCVDWLPELLGGMNSHSMEINHIVILSFTSRGYFLLPCDLVMEGDGDRGEMSANLDALVDGKEQATPGSASSSCSDLSSSTPAAQPCPHTTRTFSGLRFFGRK